MNVTGSPVCWILLAMMAISVITYLKRLVDLRRAQIDYEDFLKGVTNVLSAGNDDEALSICEETPTPVANVVATAIRNREGSARVLREAVDSQGRAEVGRLDRRLAVLAIIAQVSPLIGLLGTVIGFMKTLLAAQASEVVSRTDLFTGALESVASAALGLFVAIAVSVMYGSLRVRLERVVVELEAAASQIVGFISTLKEDARR